jgi:hypothetical protein
MKQESSPMSSIATWRSPVLLIQGDDDRNVPFSQTVSLLDPYWTRKWTYAGVPLTNAARMAISNGAKSTQGVSNFDLRHTD